MSKKIIRENWRVEIIPVRHVFLSFGRTMTEDDHSRRSCEEVLKHVRRHVDDVENSYVAHDANPVCEHCGAKWTEDSDTYNGGCCDKDQEMAA